MFDGSGVRRCGAFVAIAVLTLGCAKNEVDAPPVNAAITNQAATPGTEPDMPYHVACDGPSEDLAVLGAVCGADTNDLDWTKTDGPGMAMAVGSIGGPMFMVYARSGYPSDYQADMSDRLGYSAYFVSLGRTGGDEALLNEWKSGEPVVAGSVLTFDARFVACSEGWSGEGSFVFRSTTVSFAWMAIEPC